MYGIAGLACCYDRCMYTLITDDLHMQFDVIIIITTIHIATVLSVQATVQLHE